MRAKNEREVFLNFVLCIFHLNVNLLIKRRMYLKNKKKISTKIIYLYTINLINKCLKHKVKMTLIKYIK